MNQIGVAQNGSRKQRLRAFCRSLRPLRPPGEACLALWLARRSLPEFQTTGRSLALFRVPLEPAQHLWPSFVDFACRWG
jgi:hypothetical protein